MDGMKDPRSNAAAIGGLALIVFGLWWLVGSTGIIPAAVLRIISESIGALTLIALGIVVVMFSRRGTFVAPKVGTRLFRSRSDRWLGGVLGGLGGYLGIDPLLLRVAVLLLTVLGAGALVPAYIVMWVVVPEEPLVSTPGVPIPPAPPVPGV